MRIFLTLVATTVVAATTALIAAPAPTFAGITVDGPTGNPVVTPGSTLTVTWTGTCPAGKQCGRWDYRAPNPGAYLAFGMGTTTQLASTGVIQPVPAGEVGNKYESVAASPAPVTIPNFATAGRWNLVASWEECNPLQPGAVNIGTCDKAQSALLPFIVRAVIGTPGNDERAFQIHRQGSTKYPRGKGLLLRGNFGCNAPGASYRGVLTIQQQKKVGKRMVWRQLARYANIRATDYRGECTVARDWRIPNSVAARTKLRYSWRVGTHRLTPAARARTLTSKPFPRNDIGVGYG